MSTTMPLLWEEYDLLIQYTVAFATSQWHCKLPCWCLCKMHCWMIMHTLWLTHHLCNRWDNSKNHIAATCTSSLNKEVHQCMLMWHIKCLHLRLKHQFCYKKYICKTTLHQHIQWVSAKLFPDCYSTAIQVHVYFIGTELYRKCKISSQHFCKC